MFLMPSTSQIVSLKMIENILVLKMCYQCLRFSFETHTYATGLVGFLRLGWLRVRVRVRIPGTKKDRKYPGSTARTRIGSLR